MAPVADGAEAIDVTVFGIEWGSERDESGRGGFGSVNYGPRNASKLKNLVEELMSP